MNDSIIPDWLFDNRKLVLADFWASWCGPCLAFMPVLEDIALSMSDVVRLEKVNIDEHLDFAVKMGVLGVPALYLFWRGVVVWQSPGPLSRFILEQTIQQHSHLCVS